MSISIFNSSVCSVRNKIVVWILWSTEVGSSTDSVVAPTEVDFPPPSQGGKSLEKMRRANYTTAPFQ
jgi:hypothetical protein